MELELDSSFGGDVNIEECAPEIMIMPTIKRPLLRSMEISRWCSLIIQTVAFCLGDDVEYNSNSKVAI